MTAADVAAALGGRRSGRGWMAPCPAHDDRSPSLSLRDADGRVLAHCFGGCRQRDVIAALQARGLWPERGRRTARSPAERRLWIQDTRAAQWWALAARAVADEWLAQAEATYAARADLTRLLAVLRDDAAVLAEYRDWRAREAELTKAMVQAGRSYDVRTQRMLARYISENLAQAIVVTMERTYGVP